MFSTRTAQDAKTYVERQRKITTDDQQIRDALNEFYIMYYDAIRQADADRLRKSVSVNAAGGYDLSLITDLGDDYFEVYKVVDGETRPSHRLPYVTEESDEQGFYVRDKTLHLTSKTDPTTVKIHYEKVVSEITDATDLTAHTLDVVKRADFVLKFLLSKFYDGK